MLHIAIREIHNSITFIQGNTVDDVICTDKNGQVVEIDKTKVVAKEKELEDAENAIAYARNRKAEYPDWGDQLNKIYDDGITKWKSEMVDPVKAKWPKDNSGPK